MRIWRIWSGRRPRLSQVQLPANQTAQPPLRETIEYLWHFAQANAGWGQAMIKSLIAFYAPALSPVLNPLIDQLFALIKEGKITEAEAIIRDNHLEAAVTQTANKLERDVAAVLSTEMPNKFEIQRDLIKNAVEILFDTSRRWRCDLLLQGSLAGPHDLTLLARALTRAVRKRTAASFGPVRARHKQ